MIRYKTRKVADDFALRLDLIKSERIRRKLDKPIPGKYASDARLTRAVLKDPLCFPHWLEIEKRLMDLPRSEDKY